MHSIKEPEKLSQRVQKLRDFYFQGTDRPWNNSFTSWTTGTDWDLQYNEMTFYIVPETYMLLQSIRSSYRQSARRVQLCNDFWEMTLPERRAWFVKEVMTKYLPVDLLPGDLICGARFNIQSSLCLSREEARKWDSLILGKKGIRKSTISFHDHGYGNAGATSGHLIPDYPEVLREGWKGILDDLKKKYEDLGPEEKNSPRGGQLRAMMTSAEMPGELARRYASLCFETASLCSDSERRNELTVMAENLEKVPAAPAENFWQAVQSLWLTHMLVMSDENYPGPGVSFGRIDQYLYPYWKKSLKEGMDRKFGKEILKCFWIHANTAYDAMIQNGNQGITAGFGQLITLSGLGPEGQDMTNDLTLAILEVIDEMSPILEPKPNVRLHRDSPDYLLDKVIDMIGSSQGAPFLLNFDERSMAGLLRQARLGGLEKYINRESVYDYAPVGCLENTMCGNDRSGTVDANLNLLKAVELVICGGRDMHPVYDVLSDSYEKIKQDGPNTGNPLSLTCFDDFWRAYAEQTRYIIRRCVKLYDRSESLRARFFPTPYLSCLVKGCAQSGKDVTQGGAEINMVTLEAVTFASTVDSLLAVKYLVYDEKKCTMKELIQALRDNWDGHEKIQSMALYRAPKYGRDDDGADEMARRVMELWTDECWNYKTAATGRQFRPGMLSWNYWAGDGFILAASPDGRPKGKFLSNAICPSNGADINGPTSNSNSVGKALGGRSDNGDWEDYINLLPNGASHTISFNPQLTGDPSHREKFKAFLRGYAANGGTALQINMVSSDLLKDAQENPEEYRSLLVRITGYNAYFVTVGRELQDELIARTAHNGY